MDPAEISFKLIFFLKKKQKQKGKHCATFGCSNTFYGLGGLPMSFHFFKIMHISIYFC